MREILFRGKDYMGNWTIGNLIVDEGGDCNIVESKAVEKDGYYLCFNADNPLWVENSTVGQYTGVKDKNGTRIFEGDIVEMPRYGGGKHKSLVYFSGGKFAVDGSNYSHKDICARRMKVIGNIYDNPELMKEVEK